MRYAILGGDMRFAHLAAMLRESKRHAAAFLQEKATGSSLPVEQLSSYDCIVSNWPLRQPLAQKELPEAELFNAIKPGSVLLLCGPKFPRERRWDLQYVNLWQDETLLRENAWLTAQAAAAIAMQHHRGSLTGVRCMVVGCGRIGRALCEILLILQARVTVVSGGEAKRKQIIESGAAALAPDRIHECLPRQQVVFSTPPAMVLDACLLGKTNPEVLILDLASPPYGVDLDAARNLGRNARREPGLPGRWCPLSAARVLFNAILRWEEGELNER